MGDFVRVEREGRIGFVTLNRPEKLNAVNSQMIRELREAWATVREDDQMRVVILRGEGRAFCVGADLAVPPLKDEYGAESDVSQDRLRILDSFITLGQDTWTLPKPVIAQVHGYCIAGGTIMATFCDAIMIAEDTKVGWPQLPVGGGLISPIWSWFIGPHKAKEFSFNVGATFTGAEAVAMGWGNRAVPAETLEAETLAMAQRVAKLPLDLLSVKKAAINHQMDAQGFSSAIRLGAEMNAIAHTSKAVDQTRDKIRELGVRGAIEWFQTGDGIV